VQHDLVVARERVLDHGRGRRERRREREQRRRPFMVGRKKKKD
jgi:hypothetical protein